MTKVNVQLGDEARDTVSGFSGVCVARTEWLNGCWRMTLQPKALDKDGKPCESQTFDDFQLEVTKPKSGAQSARRWSTSPTHAMSQAATKRPPAASRRPEATGSPAASTCNGGMRGPAGNCQGILDS